MKCSKENSFVSLSIEMMHYSIILLYCFNDIILHYICMFIDLEAKQTVLDVMTTEQDETKKENKGSE